MPLHDYKCPECGARGELFVKLKDLPLVQLCDCGGTLERQLATPFVRGDIVPYKSPIDGREINSRAARRDDLARNGCVEYEVGISRGREAAAAQRESALDKSVESTIESELARMPARKRELLEQEVRAGASPELIRKSAYRRQTWLTN